jgi:hypothetical protein
MRNDAQKFIDCLEDAGQLLEHYPSIAYSAVDSSLNYKPPENFNLALFERWSEFYEPGFDQKPAVRIVQHLSCTGGTLICKCLAGLPNVAMLSEANPLSKIHIDSAPPRFSPTDLIFLASRGKFPLIDELSEKIFKADINIIAKHAMSFGKYLVIREHSHSDYLVGETPENSSTIQRLLKDDHPVLSAITVRHPVDSYLSLVKLGWRHFTPKTFDEYCRRYILFIDHNEHVPVFKYEDFINDPPAEMQRICESLDLPFNEDFQDIFDLNTLSGDSGRSSNVIQKRDRRQIDDNYQKELNESAWYLKLCEKLDYVSSLDTSTYLQNKQNLTGMNKSYTFDYLLNYQHE